MAAAEIQISETETPLHKLETVYRRLVEQLSTAAYPPSALREIVDAWFYTLEEDVLADGSVAVGDADALADGVDQLLEQRLADVARTTPAFASALRAYRRASLDGDQATAQSVLAWIGGQPNVAAAARRAAASRATSTISRRSASSKGCSPFCATPGTQACWWCSTRPRPCSGSAPTCGTKASTRSASSSTTSTRAVSQACTCSSPGRPRSTTGRRASPG